MYIVEKTDSERLAAYKQTYNMVAFVIDRDTDAGVNDHGIIDNILFALTALVENK